MQPEVLYERSKAVAIDICRCNLVKFIKCNVPCSEGYGSSNLIATNFADRNKGFMAERFIKPPVMLTMEFESEINIKYVAVTCYVGAQKTKGIEFFTKSNSKDTSYESIASGVLPDVKHGFVFHKFNEDLKNKFGDSYYFRTFKSPRFLSSVSNLQLKIFRTVGTSIPALGRIEIWGIPSKKLSLINKTISFAEAIPDSESKESVLSDESWRFSGNNCLNSSHILSMIRKAELTENFVVPEDFIDPITCEVMIQPLVLPSGKIIDSSTLKSHEKAELAWGRGPSDPFTGIPFSDYNKPIAATDLKSRIDKFLSDNCNILELQNIPRTLGGSNYFQRGVPQNSEVNVSKLISKPKLNYKIQSVNNKATDNCTPLNLILDKIKPSSSLKRKHTQIGSDSCTSLRFAEGSGNSQVVSSSSSCITNITEVGLKKRSCSAKAVDSFQDRMETSLELALKSTLSKLPKLTTEKVKGSNLIAVPLCYVCKSTENMFSIPCGHFVCRLCLLQTKDDQMPMKCLACNFDYKTCDVEKVHIRPT